MTWLQPRWALAVIIAFLVYAGALVWQSISARIELRSSVLSGLRLDAEKRAAAISYFFSERSNDVADLATSPAVAGYHANRALKMSLEYGLRANLNAIEEVFNRVRVNKTIGGSRIYDRISLLDSDGTVLVDVPGANLRNSSVGAMGGEASFVAGERFGLDRSADNIVISAPVTFRGAHLGRIVAYCSVDTIMKHHVRAANGEEQIELLAASDGRPLSPAWQEARVSPTVIAAIGANQTKEISLKAGTGGHETFALVKATIDGTPFFLVTGASESRLFEKLPPLMLILASASVPVLVLGAAIFIRRQRRLNTELRLRYIETGRRHSELRGKYSALEEEVLRREEVEQQLRLQRAELEERTIELQKAMERTHQLAMYDSVTGLANRLLFRESLRFALARAERSGRSLAVLFLDLDRFKRINDTLGHSAGDQLLREVASRLQRCLRGADSIGRAEGIDMNHCVSRQGGDEFTVLLPDLIGPESASVVASRIIDTLCQPVSLDGHEVVCTVSVGISVFPQDGTDVNTLLKNADAAMYSAKERGRNQYQVYENSLHETAVLRLALENAMRRGLDAGEFDVHYQPMLDAITGKVVSLEALLRWRHPTRGMVPPGDFIPVAEETGLIVPLTRHVLLVVCNQIAAWRKNLDLDIKVAINLSGRTIELSDVGEMIRSALTQYGVAANLLEIELTETVLMEGRNEARALIDNLKGLGISLSIDDFGTGYSSLAYLKSFAIDFLKIDRSFVRDIPGDENSETIVRTIVGMAHSLGLHVVAEGVENEAQWHFMRKVGCEVVQGFLFGRPVPAAEITQRLFTDEAKSLSTSNVTPIRPFVAI